MSTVKQCAEAFVAGKPARCHNARVDVRSSGLYGSLVEYRLHGHIICERRGNETVAYFDWCGWHSVTTANHMNHLLAAMGANLHVSRAVARDNQIGVFKVTY